MTDHDHPDLPSLGRPVAERTVSVPRPLMAFSPEARASLANAVGALESATASLRSRYPAPPPPPRPWYRRMLGPIEWRAGRWGAEFHARDWTVGVTVGQETVFISPLPMVTITYDRTGGPGRW